MLAMTTMPAVTTMTTAMPVAISMPMSVVAIVNGRRITPNRLHINLARHKHGCRLRVIVVARLQHHLLRVQHTVCTQHIALWHNLTRAIAIAMAIVVLWLRSHHRHAGQIQADRKAHIAGTRLAGLKHRPYKQQTA